MANQVDSQIVEEGYRNALVRVAGFMDTSDITLTPAFTLAQFVANDPAYRSLLGFRVDWLQYAVDPDIVVVLQWNSASPQLIATVADSNDLSFKEVGGLKPNTQLSGYDGSINIYTKGYTPGGNTGFTVLMSLVKLYQS